MQPCITYGGRISHVYFFFTFMLGVLQGNGDKNEGGRRITNISVNLIENIIVARTRSQNEYVTVA